MDRLSSTDPTLRDMIFRHESYAKALPNGDCIAYPDPESALAKTGRGSGAPWTCGFGSTGPDVAEGVVWTRAEAEARCAKDITTAVAMLDTHVPGWRDHSLPRQRVLADMTYNMGIYRLRGFKQMWAALERRDYHNAAAEMMDSLWAKQTKTRAVELETMMELG